MGGWMGVGDGGMDRGGGSPCHMSIMSILRDHTPTVGTA